MDIPKPCKEQVDFYLKNYNKDIKYIHMDNSLNTLFKELFPNNNNVEEVLIKVCCLNDFYYTNIFNIYAVSKHIVDLDIDNRLQNNDETLVNDIANITIKDKTKNFYSFATKYCCYYNEDEYPIYDSYVDKVLMYFRNKDNFSEFKKKDLKDYKKFKQILNEFINYYKLDIGLRELDRYLWLLGKDWFKKD